MANDLQPPPTYALPILVDERSGMATFNPIWLKWFLDLSRTLNNAGGIGLQHNMLGGLQGGTATERYHLTAAQHAAILANGIVVTYVSEDEVLSAAAVDTDAYSHVVTAGRLATAGETLEFEVGGTFSASSSADKRIKVMFGSTLVFDSGALAI